MIRAHDGRAECCLNLTIYEIGVNCEFQIKCMQKMNVIAKISCYFEQCRYTQIAQEIFKYSDIQYTSLTPNKILNSLIYRTLFYVNIYGSYKLSKNSPVFLAQPCK